MEIFVFEVLFCLVLTFTAIDYSELFLLYLISFNVFYCVSISIFSIYTFYFSFIIFFDPLVVQDLEAKCSQGSIFVTVVPCDHRISLGSFFLISGSPLPRPKSTFYIFDQGKNWTNLHEINKLKTSVKFQEFLQSLKMFAFSSSYSFYKSLMPPKMSGFYILNDFPDCYKCKN